MIYRIWAKRRMAQLQRWITGEGLDHAHEGVLAHDLSLSAEDLALLTAVLFEEAKQRGEAAALLAIDLSKAYDRLVIAQLEQRLLDMGLDSGLVGPMMNAARFQRRIKVMHVAGEAFGPLCGLVPGCPLATAAMSLALWRWRRDMASLPIPRDCRHFRTWVDDSTIFSTTVTGAWLAVAAGLRSMERLSATDNMIMNVQKTGIVARPEALAHGLDEAMQLRAGRARYILVNGWRSNDEAQSLRAALELGAEVEFAFLTPAEPEWLPLLFAALLVWCEPGECDEFTRGICGALGVPVLEAVAPGPDQVSAAQALAGMTTWYGPRVKSTLKDLGICQGATTQARDEVAKRHVQAFTRCRRICGVSATWEIRERLVACSALPAALYGCVASAPDSDTWAAMRKAVVQCLHRGSAFAQTDLLFGLGFICHKADPVAVWVWRCLRLLTLLDRCLGPGRLWALWALGGGRWDGPIGATRHVLSRFQLTVRQTTDRSLELHQAVGGSAPLQQAAQLRALGNMAISRQDLGVAAKRRGQSDLAKVDKERIAGMLAALPAKGYREALRAVMAADVVTRDRTRHWQTHDGCCDCGAKETVEHFLAERPLSDAIRCGTGFLDRRQHSAAKQIQKKLALPLKLQEVEDWIAGQVPTSNLGPRRDLPLVFSDASTFHPRDAAFRAVGWAVVAPGEAAPLGSGTIAAPASVAMGE